MSDKDLNDDDSLGQFPSSANPLTAMGLDPDEVRANPSLLAAFGGSRDLAAGAPPTKPAPEPSGSSGAGGIGQTPATPADDDNGMSSLRSNLSAASKAANEVPVNDPSVTALTAKQKELSTPAPLYDPQTGKMLAGDKPSTGTRIWRGVRAGLEGLAEGGIPGALVGAIDPEKITGEAYGAPNKQYQRSEQRRQQELSSTDSQLATARENWKNAVDAMKEKGKLLSDVTTAGSGIVRGANAAAKTAVDQYKAEATADNYQNKADEAEKKLQEQTENDFRKAQSTEEKNGILRDSMNMRNEIQKMQLGLAQDKLKTLSDAKTIDQWQKEQIDSINKDYTGIIGSVWNRVTQGSKADRIAEINRTADGRRAAVGLPTAQTAPTSGATPTPAQPSGKGVSLADARQLPANRGKTDAQISADIKKHGHQVLP